MTVFCDVRLTRALRRAIKVGTDLMDVDWSELIACGGYGSAKNVPSAIEILFHGSAEEREKAYWNVDNVVVVQNDLYESAVYAARLLVDKLKANPEKLNLDILGILDELARGQGGADVVEHGPLKGQSIQQLCRDAIAEVLPILISARAKVGEPENTAIQDLLDWYQTPKTDGPNLKKRVTINRGFWDEKTSDL